MAMNYKIIESEDTYYKSVYYVKETTTNQVIKTFYDFPEAKKYMKFLNLGGAFDGFTPSFILNNTSKNM